jgi:hypothetical protein
MMGWRISFGQECQRGSKFKGLLHRDNVRNTRYAPLTILYNDSIGTVVTDGLHKLLLAQAQQADIQ